MYATWAGRADEYIGALYGMEAHPLRGAEPRFVQRPGLPMGRAGAAGDSLTASLRAAVHLGLRYVQAAGQPEKA